jgi:methylenetetrahydrofolate dehydrogenase (NADP+)/methenyltetrahydrofolate cyclohydrolase
VVVGRSNIVGKPMAALLVQARAGGDATVTICHSRTKDLAAHTRRADILIVAAGRAEMITGDMIKPGAVVIDVGMNSVPDATRAKARSPVSLIEAGLEHKVHIEALGRLRKGLRNL